MFRTYELLSPTLLIAEPKLINQVLIEDFPKFSSHRVIMKISTLFVKKFQYYFLKIYALPEHDGGKSLFALDYNEWKPSRHLISPTFSLASIKRNRKLFDDSILIFLKNLEKYAISEKPFDIRSCFKSYALDTILRAFFATEVDSANDSRKIFMKDLSLEQLLALFSPKLSKIFDFRAIDKTATNYMSKTIQKIINERKQNNTKSNDLLQILLDSTYDSLKTSKIREFFFFFFL
jgi:cytochrome P450